MKIVRKENKLVSVNTVKVGQTFIEDDEVFMMCRYEGTDISCPCCDESIAISDEIRYLAVQLSSGEIFDFESYAKVELIECEVVEI